jgi:hypothetical protein
VQIGWRFRRLRISRSAVNRLAFCLQLQRDSASCEQMQTPMIHYSIYGNSLRRAAEAPVQQHLGSMNIVLRILQAANKGGDRFRRVRARERRDVEAARFGTAARIAGLPGPKTSTRDTTRASAESLMLR